MSDDLIARRFFVSGRVQGVYFRASAAEQAKRLGLRGWALNLDDGRVEVLAIGAPAAVEQFAGWLASGPPWADVVGVESVVVEPATVESVTRFTTG